MRRAQLREQRFDILWLGARGEGGIERVQPIIVEGCGNDVKQRVQRGLAGSLRRIARVDNQYFLPDCAMVCAAWLRIRLVSTSACGLMNCTAA